jgi:hypothetical protein
MIKHRRRGNSTVRVSRDVIVCSAATFALVYEVVIGGGRPAVLTACVSLLLSPLIMRVDEVRKEKNGHDKTMGNDGEDKADAAPAQP